MILETKTSFKKIFVRIVLFGSFVPLCFSLFFLYYIVKLNKDKIIVRNTDETHKIEFVLQNSFIKIIDSLHKISVSHEVQNFLNSTIQNESLAQNELKSYLKNEKLLIYNNNISYCIYGAQNNTVYAETLCPTHVFFEKGVDFIKSKNLIIFNVPYQIGALKNQRFVFSAVISFDQIKLRYPQLKSISLLTSNVNNIQLKVNLERDIFDQKTMILFYIIVLFCLVISLLSIIYGIRITYLLKTKAEESLKFATIGKIAHLLAHDIQKPFENITTFADELECCHDKKDIELLLTETKTAIKTSQSFIKNLLQELMDINTQSLNIQENLSLAQILDKCFATISKNKLENIKITLELNHKHEIKGDVTRLTRAFFNIISNAVDALQIKHSLRPEIKIQSFDYRSFVRIIFYNSNSYIEKKEIKNIFEPFYTKKESGTGLGLAIAKKMIELHKGSIFCISKKLAGVSFVVDLPAVFETSAEKDQYTFLIDDCPLTLRQWVRELNKTDRFSKIHTFLKFEDFFDFIEQKSITEKNIKIVICDYVFSNSSLNLDDAFNRLRKFYLKPIYISTDMDPSIVNHKLKRFNIILINKKLNAFDCPSGQTAG